MGEADAEYLQLYIANSRRAGFHASAEGVERWLRNSKDEENRCPHGMFYTGAGACPQCGGSFLPADLDVL